MLGAGALGRPRGMVWGGTWEGVQDGEHMYTRGRFMSMYDKPPQYCKVISLQLNKFILKKKEESEKSGLNSTFKNQRSWHPVPSFHGK